MAKRKSDIKISFEEFRAEVLQDFRLACISRETSLMGRKEVLTGKAKFGIFGDGKEIAQIALAKAFRPGDWRSGYYRDQTWMMALEKLSVEQFFAQLYAHTDPSAEPHSAGRQMNGHFATRTITPNGDWVNLADTLNSSADASPTASQMPRALGIALASKYFRAFPGTPEFKNFSRNGNEVSFVSIGDASTSEGLFWETLNAAGVLQVPLAISVWDDGYGISVPRNKQTTNDSISAAAAGFYSELENQGIDIYVCEGWNYPKLVTTYKKGIEKIRQTHKPALFHITEVTQPQGHSTSGSHERYKNEKRLLWEREMDGIKRMEEWMISGGLATAEELKAIREEAAQQVKEEKNNAWKHFNEPIRATIQQAVAAIRQTGSQSDNPQPADEIAQALQSALDPVYKDILKALKKTLFAYRNKPSAAKESLQELTNAWQALWQETISSHLHSETNKNALRIPEIKPQYSANSPLVNGFEIMNRYFDKAFELNPELVAFGEDLGKIGDVNQGFAGLQEKYGEERIFDVGIREATIIGQGIGLSMRGLRPIAEIQYLDYLLYGLQPLSDDAATLHYRTRGSQRAPLIVRTRGHRLEGIWHTGSPLGMIINSLRGMYVCVPRNMVQAAGMYQTLLRSDEPGLIIECLNGYRLKEKLPDNIGEYSIPLGQPEIIHPGDDVTLVSYGSTLRVAEEAIHQLAEAGISVELIDVQTLLPFDIPGIIGQSVKKTNRVIFLDEDVPGGASAYMLQQVLEKQDIFRWLDAEPITLSAKPHRTAYGSDGDYFGKPNTEDIVETIYKLMHQADPASFPL